MFKSVEKVRGYCTYLLSRVIHDWNDERATVLLSQCRRAIQPGGTLLLVEEVLLPGDAPCYGKLSDLNMG